MPRDRQRVCLQDGLRLNLNWLIRRRFADPRSPTIRRGISWTNSYTGELVARGMIDADMSGRWEGWLRIRLGNLDQRIILVARPRYFGGHQWYFVCPVTNRRASVLWKPPGATRFCSRQTWGRQVAYLSQFSDRTARAHQGQARIKRRLIANLDPDEWDLPPKPPRMRWRTYDRWVQRFDRYEATLDFGTAELVARLLGK